MINIAHIADIHIRGLSRHDEYRAVFNNFINSCSARGVDHIFIGGDLFHTKTSGISPEYIDLLSYLLRQLCRTAKVHITLGNHDGNLTNLSRQDAISPIVDVLQYELGDRLRLYKKSGVYQLQEGYNLCVFSCFDEEGWKDVAPVSGEVNIASFHGSVTGAVTETGWGLEGHVGVSFFNDYDFVLLGDIHKRQDLATREDSGGTPRSWISYPGSLIQQNYGEDLEHGYLHWQIADRDHWTVDFVPIASPAPWLTVQWQGSAVHVLDSVREHLPGARVRVSSVQRLSAGEADEVSTLLKREGAIEIILHTRDIETNDDLIILGESGVMKQDLRDPTTLFELLYGTYHERYQLSDEEWSGIAEKVAFYLKDISGADEVQRGTRWTLDSLTWNNTFSYGEGNSLPFSDFKGVVGFFGTNRSGKSSLVGSLLYSLYSATDRGNLKNLHAVNTKSQSCSTLAHLSSSGRRYAVSRETVKHENKKGVISSNSSLEFHEILSDGGIVNFRGEQRSDTEKPLRSMIGTADDFMLTAVATQSDVDGIIRFGGTQRKRIISRFLDIDIFDRLYERCNDDVKGLKASLKTFSDRDLESIIADCKADIAKQHQKISDASTRKDEISAQIESLQEELRSIDTGVVKDIPALQRRVTLTRSSLQTACGELDSKTAEIAKLQEDLGKLNEKLATYDLPALQASVAALESAVELRDSLGMTLKQKTQRAEVLKKNLKLLKSVPCGDSFPDCKFISSAMNDISDAGSLSSEIKGITSQLESAVALVEKLSLENASAKLLSRSKVVSLLSVTETRLPLLQEVLETCREKVTRLQGELLSHEEEYNRYADQSGQSAAIIELKGRISRLSSEASAANGEIITATSNIGRQEGRIEAAEQELVSKNDVLRSLKELEVISAAFSKKGLPSIIVAQQLPRINSEITAILGSVFNFTCELQIIDDDLEIYINDAEGRRIIELCSGMEKVVCSLAIRIALVNISSLPKPDFFIIDEGFGALDEEGVISCGKFLSALKHYFKWIGVITHVEAIKDTVDDMIYITRNAEGRSTVKYEKNRN